VSASFSLCSSAVIAREHRQSDPNTYRDESYRLPDLVNFARTAWWKSVAPLSQTCSTAHPERVTALVSRNLRPGIIRIILHMRGDNLWDCAEY
jgi:hypothetical protein